MKLQLAASPSSDSLIRTLGGVPTGTTVDPVQENRVEHHFHFLLNNLKQFAPAPQQDTPAVLRTLATDFDEIAASRDPRTYLDRGWTQVLDPEAAKAALRGAPKALWTRGNAHRPHWHFLAAAVRTNAYLLDLLAAAPELHAPVRPQVLQGDTESMDDTPQRGEFFAQAFAITPKVAKATMDAINAHVTGSYGRTTTTASTSTNSPMPKTFDAASLGLLDACEALASEYDRTVRAHRSGGTAGVLAVSQNRLAQRMADLIPATGHVIALSPTLPQLLRDDDQRILSSLREKLQDAALSQVVSAVAFGCELHRRAGGTVQEVGITASTRNCWALEAVRQAVGVWVALPLVTGSNPLSTPLAGHRYSELLNVVERLYNTCTSLAQEAPQHG